jgi:diacylglycerol kinase family enzyme
MVVKKEKFLIVFNPRAGKNYPFDFKSRVLKFCNLYRPQTECDWFETVPNFKILLAKINFDEYERLIIIGGDGTIRETAEFIIQNELNIPLAIIPAGSHNVLARQLRIPQKTKKAIGVACLGQPKAIDVCFLNSDRIFLICFSLGFWSKIINNTLQPLKNRFGFLAYLLTLIEHREFKNIEFDFTIDDRPYRVSGNSIIIANALSVLGLSFRQVFDFTDGELEVFITQNKNFRELFRMFFSLLFHTKNIKNAFKSKGKRIILTFPDDKEISTQIDGESIELDKNKAKLSAEIIPDKKISFIV